MFSAFGHDVGDSGRVLVIVAGVFVLRGGYVCFGFGFLWPGVDFCDLDWGVDGPEWIFVILVGGVMARCGFL